MARQPIEQPKAPTKVDPLNRMISYVGMKMETLERCWSDEPIGEVKRAWRSDYAEAEWKLLGDIHQTLSLVKLCEPAVKAAISAKLKGQKFNGGTHAESDFRKTVVAEAEGGEPVDAIPT